MNISKNYLRKNHLQNLEKIKTNLIKINYQIENTNNSFFDDWDDELDYLSFHIYFNHNEHYIIELEEEIKNQLPRIKDVMADIDILKKLNQK